MVNVYTIDYVPSDEHFQAILAEIKAQPWYIHNSKLQEYMQNEWLNCQPVSTECYVADKGTLYTIHNLVL